MAPDKYKKNVQLLWSCCRPPGSLSVLFHLVQDPKTKTKSYVTGVTWRSQKGNKHSSQTVQQNVIDCLCIWDDPTLVIRCQRLKLPAEGNALPVRLSPAKPETTAPPGGQEQNNRNNRNIPNMQEPNALTSSLPNFGFGGGLFSTWWLTSSCSMVWLSSLLLTDVFPPCKFCWWCNWENDRKLLRE